MRVKYFCKKKKNVIKWPNYLIILYFLLDSVVKAQKKHYPYTLLEECKDEIKKIKMENLMDNDLEEILSDQLYNEGDNDSNDETESENDKDNDESNEKFVKS